MIAWKRQAYSKWARRKKMKNYENTSTKSRSFLATSLLPPPRHTFLISGWERGATRELVKSYTYTHQVSTFVNNSFVSCVRWYCHCETEENFPFLPCAPFHNGSWGIARRRKKRFQHIASECQVKPNGCMMKILWTTLNRKGSTLWLKCHSVDRPEKRRKYVCIWIYLRERNSRENRYSREFRVWRILQSTAKQWVHI